MRHKSYRVTQSCIDIGRQPNTTAESLQVPRDMGELHFTSQLDQLP